MNETKKEIAKLLDDAESLAEVRDDVLGKKVSFTIDMVGQFLKKAGDKIDDLIEISQKADYYDPKLAEGIKSSIGEALKAIAKIKSPEVNVSVDLKPIESIATEINKQNENILKLLTKLTTPNGQQNEGLYKLIVSMVEKNNAFIDKGIKQVDYSEQIKAISKTINENKRATEWKFEGYKERDGKITITATAKK